MRVGFDMDDTICPHYDHLNLLPLWCKERGIVYNISQSNGLILSNEILTEYYQTPEFGKNYCDRGINDEYKFLIKHLQTLGVECFIVTHRSKEESPCWYKGKQLNWEDLTMEQLKDAGLDLPVVFAKSKGKVEEIIELDLTYHVDDSSEVAEECSKNSFTMILLQDTIRNRFVADTYNVKRVYGALDIYSRIIK